MSRNEFTRSAGILMAVSSLPSPYGIGTFGKEAYKFVDFVKECGHKYWQVLPLGPTTYGDSPYQSFSAFAGNPYFIDMDILIEEGLLDREDVLSYDWGEDASNVDYEKMYSSRFKVLHHAYERFKLLCEQGTRAEENAIDMVQSYEAFLTENKYWLEDYALFMAVKDYYGGKCWTEWGRSIKFRRHEAIVQYSVILKNEIGFWKFVQFEFTKQWNKLKGYANENGVEIIGDIPIYMGIDSSDVWANTEEFQLDCDLKPVKVAGVPPDAFSQLGQKWGNPLYDWDKMEQNGFTWWRRRMSASAKLYDVIRIDHFIGIVKFYEIPADMPDARQGQYQKGPGQKLLDVIGDAIGDKKLIAEDLGVEVPEVKEILNNNGYPGMKVLEFAFGGERDNPHLPHCYTKNCVVYGGTHDNETLMGYYSDRTDEELAYAIDYLDTNDRARMVDNTFRAAYASVADLAVFAVQDILKLDNSARMNLPSSLGINWKWRMLKGQLTQEHVCNMRHLASVFGRGR
ncbi:MAG: 4-alpha-glucanotransferase [Eubacteriales bacterium]|nr:4-alpha-glucanotransferase [Eubacteriales bacterium]